MIEFPIRAAIIGTGGIAHAHMRALTAADGRVEVAAVVDIEEERASSFAEQYDIDRAYTDSAEMLREESPQLVHIATPPGTHCDLSIQSMEAGAWVLCEKPLCASLAEMDRIEEAEKRTGNFCSSVFQWRFGSGGRHLKHLIDSGTLGKPMIAVVLTTWYRTAEYYAVPWRGRWDTELGGCSMGHGIHAMDFLLWLYGEWREVRSMMDTLDRDIDVEDVSMASVRFANGAMANITNSVVSPRQESYLRFDFQKATAELTHLYSYRNADWRFSTIEGGPFEDELESWRSISEDLPSGHGQQLGAFLEAMQAGVRPPVSGADVRGTIEFLSALYKSAMTGHAVARGSIQPGDPFYVAMCGPCDSSWQVARTL